MEEVWILRPSFLPRALLNATATPALQMLCVKCGCQAWGVMVSWGRGRQLGCGLCRWVPARPLGELPALAGTLRERCQKARRRACAWALSHIWEGGTGLHRDPSGAEAVKNGLGEEKKINKKLFRYNQMLILFALWSSRLETLWERCKAIGIGFMVMAP